MDAERRSLYLYLLPVFGFFPAWWTLYRYRNTAKSRSATEINASRLSVTLGLLWLTGHLLTEFGANHTESHSLSLLIFSSLWTSSYILIELGLMVRVWQGRSLRIPGIDDLSRKLP
jgi:formate-dependent nitrite reductase membrane component NrfD